MNVFGVLPIVLYVVCHSSQQPWEISTVKAHFIDEETEAHRG
jgi:hypothetical protein